MQSEPENMEDGGSSYTTAFKSSHLFFVVVGCMVFIIALQGLLFVSMAMYSILIYRFINWMPSHMIIGGIVTYSLYVVGLVLVFLLLNRLNTSQWKIFDTAFRIASSLYLILYPITPVLWYDNRYSIEEPASGFLYGFSNPIFLVFIGVGVIILLVSTQKNRMMNSTLKISSDVTYLVTFFCLAIVTVIASFIGAYFLSNLGYLEVRATPFTLIPNIVGFSLFISTMINYVHGKRLQSTSK
jgi:hypothetical protein